MAKARDISQMATPIVYVAIKLRNKSKTKSVPPADGGEGGKTMKKIKKFIDELNLVLKISRTLGLLSSSVAVCYVCYLLFVGSCPMSKLNIS